MPFDTCDELPNQVRWALSADDQKVWMSTYNSSLSAMKNNGFELPSRYASIESLAREKAWESCEMLSSSRFVDVQFSVEIIDKQKEILKMESLLEQGRRFIELNGVGHIDHSSRPHIYFWKIYEGIDSKSGKPSLCGKANYMRGSRLADIAWLDQLNGKQEWSVGVSTRTKYTCNMKDGCYNDSDVEELFEISNVKSGANPNTETFFANKVKTKDHIGGNKYIPRINYTPPQRCPMVERYNLFQDLIKYDNLNLYTGLYKPGIVLITGDIDTNVMDVISEAFGPVANISDVVKCDNAFQSDGPIESSVVIVRRPAIGLNEVLHDIVHGLISEQEAISNYGIISKNLNDILFDYEDPSNDLTSIGEIGGQGVTVQRLAGVRDIILRIREEEIAHMGELMNAITSLDADFQTKIPEGMNEDKDIYDMNIKSAGCPHGFHEHPGIVGCHPMERSHHGDKQLSPNGMNVVSDDNIDISRIKNASTDSLKAVVKRVAQTLIGRTEDELNEFLASTEGKEFILIVIELKKRKGSNDIKKPEEDNMTNVLKGDVDLATALSNVGNGQVAALTKLDALTDLVKALINKGTQAGAGQLPPITDAIAGAVSEINGEDDKEDTQSGNSPPFAEENENKDQESEESDEESKEDAGGPEKKPSEESKESSYESEVKNADKKEEDKMTDENKTKSEEGIEGVQTSPLSVSDPGMDPILDGAQQVVSVPTVSDVKEKGEEKNAEADKEEDEGDTPEEKVIDENTVKSTQNLNPSNISPSLSAHKLVGGAPGEMLPMFGEGLSGIPDMDAAMSVKSAFKNMINGVDGNISLKSVLPNVSRDRRVQNKPMIGLPQDQSTVHPQINMFGMISTMNTRPQIPRAVPQGAMAPVTPLPIHATIVKSDKRSISFVETPTPAGAGSNSTMDSASLKSKGDELKDSLNGDAGMSPLQIMKNLMKE